MSLILLKLEFSDYPLAIILRWYRYTVYTIHCVENILK